MTAGRPTKLTDEARLQTKQYIKICEDEDIQQLTGLSVKGTELYKNKLNVHLPSIEGLARYLHVNKTTIYEWCKEDEEFSNDIESLRNKQAETLINKGLSGDYNPTIAKVLLTKHGYREGVETDITTQGEKIQSSVLPEVIAEADRLLKERKLNEQ